MFTGLEPMLGPAIAKAAGAGVTRVGGWGAGELLRRRRRRKIRSLMTAKSRAAYLEAVEGLPAEQLTSLRRFCESVEVEHTTTCLARAYLLEGTGKPAEKHMTATKAEFAAALNLWLGGETDDLVSEAIFSALQESVLQHVKDLLARPQLANNIEAELIAVAGSMAAASIRNTELLESIENLDELRRFEREYKSQVAAIHATMRLPHAGTTRQVPYKDLFVQPLVWFKRAGALPDDGVERASIDRVMRTATRVVVLGDPGGGKSTLSRKLTYDLAIDALAGFENRTPFFVELREYAKTSVRGTKRQTLVNFLEEICQSPYSISPPELAIEYLLLNNKAVVVFDGLDELLDISLRREVVQAVEGFAHRYPTCPIIVTSRRVGYEEAPLSDTLFETVHLGEFHHAQVHEYVRKWFTLDETIEGAQQHHLADTFMTDSEFVSDLRVNPLMLSLMCGIYASEHYIPRNRPDVYEKCALLLFERWDKQRGIVPDLSFDAHVQAALRALALHMFERQIGHTPDDATGHLQEEGMSRTALVGFLTKYLRDKRFDNDEDAENAANEFVDFCKGRAWVLTDVGASTYGFTHRTFLEYFAASQLVRLHTSAESLYPALRPYIRSGAAEVVAQLAVQILGKTTEDGADDLLDLILKDSVGSGHEDVMSMAFAARSLHFVVPRPKILKDICARVVQLDTSRAVARRGSDPVLAALGCSQENAPRVGAALRESLEALFAEGDPPERAIALATMPPRYGSDANAAYWGQWAEDNLLHFAKVVDSSTRKYYWLAVLRYERGDITVEDLLDTHGAKALYSYKFEGKTSGRAPFVYRFSPLSGGTPFGLVGPMPRSRYRKIRQDLLEALPRLATPWLRYENQYVSSALALQPNPGCHRVDNLLLTLALPLLEISEVGAEPRGVHPLFEDMLAVRAGGVRTPEIETALSALQARSRSAAFLVDNWLRGEVSLLARARRKEAGETRRGGR